jgi:integrase
MAREILTALQVRNQTKPGKYGDGGGLYLNVRNGGSKSWLFVYRDSSLPRDKFGNNPQVNLSLGTSPLVSLAQARIRAAEARGLLSEGKSPKAARKEQQRQANMPLFSEMAEEYVASKANEWKSERHRQQVLSNLVKQCGLINGKRIDLITVEDVRAVVEAYAKVAHNSALRLRGTLERIFDNAQVRGLIDRNQRNPADLGKLLPKAPKAEHHAAMPYADVPAFIQRLRDLRPSVVAYALEFAILCGSRSGEVRGAEWSEIDLGKRLWNIPGEKMKAGDDHTVPLTDAAVEILLAMQAVKVSDLVFPGTKPNAPITAKSFERLLAKMEAGCVAHGFRSTFRDWAGDCTNHKREVAEVALAHVTGNATERAYRRSKALAKHRALMEAWAQYLSAKDNVVQLRA